MGRRYLETRYEYTWNPLVGCVLTLLDALDRRASMPTVSAAIGVAFAPPAIPRGEPAFPEARLPAEAPASLEQDLRALGLNASVIDQPLGGRSPRLLTRRLKRDLDRGRPVIALGAGVDAFGLLIGYNDERGAYYRDGPLTEEVGPWLPYEALTDAAHPHAPARLLLVRASAGTRNEAALRVGARQHALGARPDALHEWADLLAGETPVNPQGHAFAAQALAAARGAAADYWREAGAAADVVRAYNDLALALSRFATLFPYPAGGNPGAAGMRRAGAQALRAGAGHEADALAALRRAEEG